MGRRGPRKEPAALTILRGNPGKRPIPEQPDLPEAEASPADKGGLTGVALEEYERLRPVLIDAGVLTSVDEWVFEQYCRLTGELADLEKKVAAVQIEDAVSLGYMKWLHSWRAQA